jgi:hypothetical protein
VQHDNAADAETRHGRQRDTLRRACAEVQTIGEDGSDGAEQSQHIEPERGADAADILTQAQLQEKGGEADRRNYH